MDSNKVMVGLLLVTVMTNPAVSGVKVLYYSSDNSRPAVLNNQPQTINIQKLTPGVPLPHAQKKLSDDWWETDDLHSAGSTLGVHSVKPYIQDIEKQTDDFNWKDIESAESALNFKVESFVQSAIGSSTHGKFVGPPDPKDTKIDHHKPVPEADSVEDTRSVSEELSDYGSDEEYYDDETVSSEIVNKDHIEAITASTTSEPIQKTTTTNPQKTVPDLNLSESISASKLNQAEKETPKTESTKERIESTSQSITISEVTTRKPKQDVNYIKSASLVTESNQESTLNTETAKTESITSAVANPNHEVDSATATVVFLKSHDIEGKLASELKAKDSNKNLNTKKIESISESISPVSKSVLEVETESKSIAEVLINPVPDSVSSVSAVEVKNENSPIYILSEHENTSNNEEQLKEDSNDGEREVSEHRPETSASETFVKRNFYRLFPKSETPSVQKEDEKPTLDYRTEDYRLDIESSTSPESFTIDRPEISEGNEEKSSAYGPTEEIEHLSPIINRETEVTFPSVSHTELREPIPYSHHSQSKLDLHNKFVEGFESTQQISISDSLSSSSDIPLTTSSIQHSSNEEFPSNESIDYHPSTELPLTNERGETLMGLFFRTKPPLASIPKTFDQSPFYPSPPIKKKPIEPSYPEFQKPVPEKARDSSFGVTERRPPPIPFHSSSLPVYEETRGYNPRQNPFPSGLTKILEPLHSVVRFENGVNSSPSLRPFNQPEKHELPNSQNHLRNIPTGHSFREEEIHTVGVEHSVLQRPIATNEPLQPFSKAEHQKTVKDRQPGVQYSRPYIARPQDDRVNSGSIQQVQSPHQLSRPTPQHSQSENAGHENSFKQQNSAPEQQQETSFSTLSNEPLVSRNPHQPQSQLFNPPPVDNRQPSPPAAKPTDWFPRAQNTARIVYPVPIAFRAHFHNKAK